MTSTDRGRARAPASAGGVPARGEPAGDDGVTPGGTGRHGAAIVRAARVVGAAGATWGLVSTVYLLWTWVDDTTITVLHNPVARRAELGYGAVALVIAASGLLIVVRGSGRALRWLVPAWAIAYGVAAARAVDASPRRDRLASDLLFVVPPALLLASAAVVAAVALAPRHPVRAGAGAGVIVVSGVALVGATLLSDPAREARVFAGLEPHWHVERAVDNVFVDGAGVAWGVRPWALARTTSLYRFDGERFLRVSQHDDGWPPTVLGTTVDGGTVMVSSDAEDPFTPVFEVYTASGARALPSPEVPLPPLDAVALDPATGRLYGLHSDFTLPARAVIEIFDGESWRSVEAPIRHPGRLAAVDLAVDPRGRLWVWHEGEPTTIHRYDGDEWTSVRLPFRARTVTDPDALPITMAPFETFLADARGRLWLFDGEGRRLAALGADGTVVAGTPLPADCVPVTIDDRGRVWCRRPGGLSIVGPGGVVLYDSLRAGLPHFDLDGVSVTHDRSWVLVQRGAAQELFRFDHTAALGDAPG